jgi:hypothetical protein
VPSQIKKPNKNSEPRSEIKTRKASVPSLIRKPIEKSEPKKIRNPL